MVLPLSSDWSVYAQKKEQRNFSFLQNSSKENGSIVGFEGTIVSSNIASMALA